MNTDSCRNSGRLGLCIHSLMIRSAADRDSGARNPISDPLTFLEYCHRLGAAGLQMPLGTREADYIARFRQQAEAYGVFIEGSVGLPRDERELGPFEAAVRAAQQMGASVLRTVMIPGRRYERFGSRDEFRQLAEQGWKSLQLAEPIAARHRMRLAVENHKDHRVAEKLDVLKRLSSEWVGLCVDTGNDIALLEDPMALVEAYAPFAFTVHLKDMAVQEYEDGFLLSEVPLGEGILDLAQMAHVLRQAKPDVGFTLEMITRDPLQVPCLTPGYWAALQDVPGRELARTLSLVRAKASAQPLPRVSHRPLDEQLRVEEANIVQSLRFARAKGLG
ncbi:MAG: sugar phosphate isomerase/epimerase [Planctomycetes bacterium]|nr:sugar phosphate isomerase/epimerase [Planctomycetota bacterium]